MQERNSWERAGKSPNVSLCFPERQWGREIWADPILEGPGRYFEENRRRGQTGKTRTQDISAEDWRGGAN